ncbi:AAA family ATPase [Silvanigrella aquatica]|uniref:UvrD-like helicase C-terminal domain-containing protein n=1 Tax=Silvanigrella aquatica TaxID=1915309 RepID=A0A1L4D4Z6_9BACT|nr:AAA family ATPase [Silvanigrella aquatica]APJ05268.1 hypothetical protein AXG55_14700 [Silvanigrella aquatica]
MEAVVISKSLDSYTYEKIKIYINDYLKNNAVQVGELSKKEFITKDSLALENKTIEILKRGHHSFESICTKEESANIIEKIHNKSLSDKKGGLNKGQQEAINTLLTSNDRILAWQGVAGAGKTFSLYSATRVAMEKGYKIKALAPGSDAAKNLAAEAKLSESATVASLLVKESKINRAEGKELWVVDEAGMLSAKDAEELLKKAEIENARILLVGDVKQLSSVGAGNPFKQLQSSGMETAHLTQGMRQRDKNMKKSVDLIADKKFTDGLDILEKTGKIYEKNKEEIIASMAIDYLSLSKEQIKKSLFISSTNYEKQEITNLIRSELKTKNELKNTVEIKTYSSRDLNEFSLRYSNSYEIGDILILNKAGQGLKANTAYKIENINNIKNTITVSCDNKLKELKLGSLKCNLFQEKSMEICEGDRIKWTKNHVSNSENKEKRLNGQYLNVKQIDKENMTAIVEYESGKFEKINLNEKHYIDYSYVTTVFSSQGRTCEKVYASLTNVDSENFYVAVSRAEYDCKLYTHDKDNLYKKVNVSGVNETAHEKIGALKNSNLDEEKEVLKNKNKIQLKEYNEKQVESIKIMRKIKEKSFEILYKLNLEPNGNTISKLKNEDRNNFDIIKKELDSKVNSLLNIKNNYQRMNLNLDTLKETYSLKVAEISKEMQKNIYHQLNNNIDNKIKNDIINVEKNKIKRKLRM